MYKICMVVYVLYITCMHVHVLMNFTEMTDSPNQIQKIRLYTLEKQWWSDYLIQPARIGGTTILL